MQQQVGVRPGLKFCVYNLRKYFVLNDFFINASGGKWSVDSLFFWGLTYSNMYEVWHVLMHEIICEVSPQEIAVAILAIHLRCYKIQFLRCLVL